MLTDAQYLAACRALLGIKPEQNFSDAFVAERTEALLNPTFVRAALTVAFEAGRESVLNGVRRVPPPTTLPRGECPTCGKTTRLNTDGSLRNHDLPRKPRGGWAGRCPGSHGKPKAVAS